MWSVLRRQQGEDYQPSSPTRGDIRENLNHIARFESKPNAKPLDPQVLAEPYEARVYSKLILNLQSLDLVLRQKAVKALIELFGQKTEHIARTIEAGGIRALLVATKDESEDVRVDACIALTRLVGHPKGHQVVLEHNLFTTLMGPVSDTPAVAVNALRTLQALDAHWDDRAGTAALIQAGCIELYVGLARDGCDAVKVEALWALSKVYNVKEAFIRVLQNQGMGVLTGLLESSNTAILEAAAENVGQLSFYSAGKRAAVQDPNTTVRLLSLIDHDETRVRLAATAALMGISIDNKGKELVMADNGVERLMDCLQAEAHDGVQVNLLKTICNISENPAARIRLQPCVLHLHTIKSSGGDNPVLANSATRAIEMITWKP